ncbi:FtsX-like permease family protein [Maribellus sp. YY47]|uniref:ABC transporter permease n=1 Tax=Maribellus sp. YY47 TaxID=2929486 RepID=UPI002000AADD|nr:FtsX-like permease family protein [Maribellus sp. YY47]MCK3686282.1 ABC transporter permease [Maribellus sp. YY47]
MNTELFIAKRLFSDKATRKLLSQRIIRIALIGIALGLAVMIVSVAVVTGFKKEIRDRVIGFGSSIQIINYDSNSSYETRPVSSDQPFLEAVRSIPGVKYIQPFATKPGMMKTNEYHQGIIFKGVTKDYNWDFFAKNLVTGHVPALNDSNRVREIILSEYLSNLLNIKLNDQVVVYFINEKDPLPRLLQLTVCGIYRSGFEEFDKIFILGDLKQVQRLNDWRNDQISGFEVAINNFNQIDNIEQEIRNSVIQFRDAEADIMRTESITRLYPQIFDWLSVLDMNVWIILLLMVIVASFNMVSGLLVLILERASMIGVLKAMGSANWSIRKVFIYLSVFLTGRGMLWGNAIGITIVLAQGFFHLIKLDPTAYYVDYVPMNFSVLHLLLLNLGTITVTSLILIIPSWLISRISPDKTIRFD